MTRAVYLDLDGVLVDFIGGALDLLGLPDTDRARVTHWDALSTIAEDRGLCRKGEGHDYVWARIDMAGEGFWAGLRTLPAGMALLTGLLAGGAPVVFVTASSRHHSSAAGKQRWLAENLPHDVYQGKPLHRRFAICPTKHLLAHPDAVLIDDRTRNIDLFREAGGVGFLWPQPWNCDRPDLVDYRTFLTRLLVQTLTVQP